MGDNVRSGASILVVDDSPAQRRRGRAQAGNFPVIGCPSTWPGMLRYRGTFGGKSARPDSLLLIFPRLFFPIGAE